MNRLLEKNEGDWNHPTLAEGTWRPRPWPVILLPILLGFLGILSHLPPSGHVLFHQAQAHDPTLATSSLELVWAMIAAIPSRLFEWIPLDPQFQSILIPSLAMTLILGLGLPGSPYSSCLFCLLVLYWTGSLGFLSQGRLQPDGVDALVAGVLLIIPNGLSRDSRMSRFLTGVIGGFLAAEGWVYTLGALFHFRFIKRDSSTSALGFGLGILLSLVLFGLLKIRYPHPDLVTDLPLMSLYLSQWIGGSGLSLLESGEGWIGFVERFPGFYGVVLVGLSGLTAFIWGKIWRLSAGRTVPVQFGLYTLALFPILAVGWFSLPTPNRQSAPVTLESIWSNLRTLREKIPDHTELLLPADLFGVLQALRIQEEFGRDVRVDVYPERMFNRERPQDPDPSTRVEAAPTRIRYDGKNVVYIESEPLSFTAQYLLDASTEVWAATPAFFVANNPTDATGQPTVYFEGRRLVKGSRSEPRVSDWNYDGKHIYLFRAKEGMPWDFPVGDWRIDYTGYLLADEFQRFGERRKTHSNVPLQAFY